MPGKFGLPDRPELQRSDYQLGQDPEWLRSFTEGSNLIRQDAVNLGGQGKHMAFEARDAQGRTAPGTDFRRASSIGGQQVGAANWLQNFANSPQGPSAAQAQLQQGANRSMAQNLALARSGSGFGESANSIANAQRANADTMATTSNQAAQLRAAEDQAYRAQQMQAMSGAADIYGGAAAREGGQSQFLTDAALRQRGMNDAQTLGLSEQGIQAQNMGQQNAMAAQNLGMGAAQSELEARIAAGNTEAQNYSTAGDVFATREKRDRELAEQRRKNRSEVAETSGKVVGAIASMFSDPRTKKRVRRVDDELDAAFAALEGSE